ncbi:MAG: hypothetical protein NZ550_02770 [Fimbriimonadales bacterium]|nr:hypothetical protein [Fimbriimonadales bacterium]MDW8051681.1 hypothetical protein [Armatimonadota bacterium]
MHARAFLRYGVSFLMVGLGVWVIYSEYFVYGQPIGLVLGSMLIAWAFVRVWALRRFVEHRRR